MFKKHFTDELGYESEIEYRISGNLCGREIPKRRFGIIIEKRRGEITEEICEIKDRFYTAEEAELTAKMLCENNVTPCTAEDIINDL